MKVIGKYSTYQIVKRLSVLVFLLLLYAPFIANNEIYVICLEGNGQIVVEKQHYDGTNPFINNPRHSSPLSSPGNNKCNKTKHIILADISCANEICFDIDFGPPQFLQDVVHPQLELLLNNYISSAPFLTPPSSSKKQQITAIRSTVLLI